MADEKGDKDDFKVGEEQFNVGDVVHLKCGGPNMVIEKLVPPGSSQYGMDRESSATCIWLVEGRDKKTDNFLLLTLGKGKCEDVKDEKKEKQEKKPHDALQEKHEAELQGHEVQVSAGPPA